MSQQENIRVWRLMRRDPIAEVLCDMLNWSAGSILWVDLRVNHMSLRQRDGQYIMDMRREALETALVAHEAVDIDQQKGSARAGGGLHRTQRLHRRGAGVLRCPLFLAGIPLVRRIRIRV